MLNKQSGRNDSLWLICFLMVKLELPVFIKENEEKEEKQRGLEVFKSTFQIFKN